MGVTVEIEVGEIRDRRGRAVSRHLACPYEPSETLGHFNVYQVGRMELVLVSLWILASISSRVGRAARRTSSARR